MSQSGSQSVSEPLSLSVSLSVSESVLTLDAIDHCVLNEVSYSRCRGLERP